MFKNYFTIAIRILIRHKIYVLINLLGMGIALACCIVTFLNLDYKLRFDEHHRENAKNVFRINTIRDTDKGPESWGLTPIALGSVVENNIPEINHLIRLHNGQAIVRVNEKTFAETIHYADMEMLSTFNFPLLYGQLSHMDEPNKVVISESAAIKFFGRENPLDQEISIIDQFERNQLYIVGGVTNKIPENTSIQFDILIPFEHFLEPKLMPGDDWKNDTQITIFAELSDASSAHKLGTLLDAYVSEHNLFREDFQVKAFYFQPFEELAFTSDIDLPDWVRGRALNRNAIGFLVTITTVLSLLILLTSCFNYTNTSIAFSSSRLKEIGLRKVLGGNRKQLIRQFMVENLILCTLSILLGIVLSQYLIEAYNSMFDQQLDMRYIFTPRVIIFLLLLPFLTAILAGSYPAFYISRYQPVAILKGKTKFVSMSRFSRWLLVGQFSFSCFALIIGIILTQNAAYQQKVDYGYDLKKIAVAQIEGEKDFDLMTKVLANHKFVESLGGSAQLIGQSVEVEIKLTQDGIAYPVRQLQVGVQYLPTVGIEIVGGRGFTDSQSDQEQGIIINQLLADQLFPDRDPLNEILIVHDKPYQIIGIAENHKEFGLTAEEPPCFFSLAKPEQYSYLSISSSPDHIAEAYQSMMDEWFRINTDKPFNGFLQENLIFKQLYINQMLRNLCIFLTIITLLTSAAGFYSIVSLNILRRTKEIGIRKVLGGTVAQMIQLISQGFVKYIIAAFVIGSIGGYLLIQYGLFQYLYVYHIPLGPGIFLFALCVMLMVPALTIGLKVYKTATINPAESLSNE